MIVYEFVEDDLYYIRYYALGREYKGTNLKLRKNEYEEFKNSNVEI
ncbi:hypothetical protein [Tissierella sp.]|nr:hypothetical protein [Tissierella sp.]